MSFTPHHPGVASNEVHSPDIFMTDIRCNLDSQFLNARESIQAENMCVYARVRPMLPQEEAKGYKECIAAVDEKTIRTVIPVSSTRYKSSRQSEDIEDFSYSAVFGPEIGQFVFFLDTMLPTLQNFVEGDNSLIFSYGITGSGKTYTLQGNSENPGIIPLSLRLYFAAVEKQLLEGIKVKPNMYNNIIALSPSEQKEEYRAKKQLLSLYDDECDIVPGSFRSSNSKSFAMTLCDLFSDDFKAEERQTTLGPEDMASAQAATVMKEVIRNSAVSQQGICNVWVSFVEIYNENIFDLLTPVTNERKRLMLRECNGNVYIEGAREICISNGDEALKILNIGRKNLSIASTKMNYQSSRSHCIYTIRVVRVRDANNLSYGRVNRLSFCDLAGSERAAKTQTTGIRLKEAGSINTSLLVLGRCLEQLRMNQMGKDKRMIPFRDSKLTRLFSGFFMGQGKAVMIANASPCDYTFDETFHVLKFSALARKLKINDTFCSDATSTLQSICNDLANSSSRYMCNESTDSVDSDYDIIQKKDEIIEKLLILAEKLTKKEQEMADMEMKIRQEVCREYSEYSDQLLEDKRIFYEEQMEAMRENYKRLIAKKEKMYENIIEDYKHQLNETVDSSEDTFNKSDSVVELENSVELSPGKSLNCEKMVEKSKESYQSQGSKLIELQSSLKSVTAELEKTKEELFESQKLIANLDKELKICKEEKENLSNECINYKNVASKSEEDLRKYEVDVKDLEEQLSILRRELNATKEFNQNQEFNLLESKSDNDMLKNEITTLKKDIDGLKDVIETYEANMEEYKAKISDLENKLLCSENSLVSAKEDLQIHINSVSKMETENEKLKSKIEVMNKECNELQNTIQRCDDNTKDYENKIAVLEDKLLTSEKNYELVQEELQLKSDSNSKIEKGLKSEIGVLNKEKDELQNTIQQYNINFKDFENKIAALEDKLLTSEKNFSLVQEELQLKSNSISKIEKENEMLKIKIGELNTENGELQNGIQQCNVDIKDYKDKIAVLEDKLLTKEKNYALIQEKLQLKSNSGTEIEKENEMLKIKIGELNTEKDELRIAIQQCNIDIKDHKDKIAVLEDKLLTNEKKYALVQEELQLKSNSVSTIEKGMKDINLQNEKMRREIKELNERKRQDEEILTDYKAKIHTLEDKILSINQNYVKAEKELQNHSKDKSELEKELKSKILDLEKEMEELQNVNAKYKTTAEEYQNNMKVLEEKFQSTQIALEVAEKQVDEKSTNILELKKEIDMHKKKIKILEASSSEAAKGLKEVLEESESKRKKFEQMAASLQKELKVADDEMKKIFLLSEELLSEIEVDKGQEKDNAKVQRNYEQISDGYKSYQSVTKTLKEKIASLQQDLYVANKNIDLIRKEMKVRETVSAELEKEIDMHKLDKEELRGKVIEKDELEKKFMSLNLEFEAVKDLNKRISAKLQDLEKSRNSKEFQEEAKNLISEKFKLEEELLMVQKKLDTAEGDIQEKNSKIAELEIDKNAHESEIQKLKKDQQTIESELTEKLHLINIELKTAKDEVEQLSSKLCKLQNEKSTHESEIQKLKQDQEMVDIELKTAKDEVEQLSSKLSELQNEKSTHESETQKLKQDQQMVDIELKTAKYEVEQLSSKLCQLQNEKSACESEIEKLKLSLQMAESEKLQLIERELRTANDQNHELSSKLSELQNEKSTYVSEIDKLKQQQVQETTLSEKLLSMTKELEAANGDNQQKSSKLHELQNSINALKLEMEVIQEEKQNLTAEKMALEEKITVAEGEISILKKDVQQKSINEQKLENEICVCKEEVNKLKEDYDNLHLKKLKAEQEVDCYKEKLDELQKKSPCEQTDDTNAGNLNKIRELEKEIKMYKLDIKKMKDYQELSEKEKEDLMMVISTNNEKIEDLEDKLITFNEDLKAANDDILVKANEVEGLQNCLAQLYTLLDILEKCETRATDRIKELQDAVEKSMSQELYLHSQIKNKETSIEELEKAVFDLQEQLKNVQRSCDHKLVSEIEQHEIEIEQTMKLKHLVEEENINLKKQKLKSEKSPDKKKSANRTEALTQKTVDNKGKENLPKISSTRRLRKKEINLKEESFTSIESSTPVVDKGRSRKRISDEDFEPSLNRVSKKLKSTEASKIPTKRPSRKKLLSDKGETLSPIQKIANTISSKVKVLSSNMPHMSSPRLTRGRKKLFNVEAPSISERTTKGKK